LKNTDWPKAEIEKVAKSSGKPLEVLCAQIFLGHQWNARLGSYYQDSTNKTRELDVLAEKEVVLENPPNFTVRVRALVSCRGFPADQSALVYSVSPHCVPSFTPMLLGGHLLAKSTSPGGPIPPLEQEGAVVFLAMGKLNTVRPIVAFDVTERKEERKRSVTAVSFERKGDKQIFEAIDSCVNAAQSWVNMDYLPGRPFPFAALNVPVCLLSMPFWDVCIDNAKVGSAEIQRRGYQTIRHPGIFREREIMTVMWAAEELDGLLFALDHLFDWFRGEIELRAKKGAFSLTS
jgi:hypothetical protein